MAMPPGESLAAADPGIKVNISQTLHDACVWNCVYIGVQIYIYICIYDIYIYVCIYVSISYTVYIYTYIQMFIGFTEPIEPPNIEPHSSQVHLSMFFYLTS